MSISLPFSIIHPLILFKRHVAKRARIYMFLGTYTCCRTRSIQGFAAERFTTFLKTVQFITNAEASSLYSFSRVMFENCGKALPLTFELRLLLVVERGLFV